MTASVLQMRFVPLEVRDGERLLGVVPAMLRSRGPVATLNWVPFPYLGPLVERENLEPVLVALRVWQRRQRVAIARLGFSPAVTPDSSMLRANGYTIESHTTMTVHLTDRTLPDVERGLSATTRKKVRRAERGGATVAAATRADLVGLLPAAISEAFEAQGMASHYPDSFGTMVWDTYGSDPTARLAVAKVSDRSIGVMVTLADSRRAYLVQGGVLRAERSTNAGVLLDLDAIRWAHGAGLAALDMVGAPNEGIANYKASFGAVPEPFTVAQRVNSRLYKVAQRGHQAVLDRWNRRAAKD